MPEMLSHFSGRFADATAILPSGPLNWGQLAGFEHDVTTRTIAITGMTSDLNTNLILILKNFKFSNFESSVVNILFFFDFYTSFTNYGYFQPVI
jgi:hypothetical protein